MSDSKLNEIGKTYQRPWGSYTTLALANGYQIKTITVNPNGKLSLQSHFHRAEHWVVVKGIATITIGEQTAKYKVNETVHIPIETKHRLENNTDEEVTIVEVQVGDYLGEDDIVRYDDIYKRI